MIQIEHIIRDLHLVRDKSPLVHNITNFVVMNNTANALLAVGASPVMAHSCDEVAAMAAIASSLVINIGTLESAWVESTAYRRQGLPWRSLSPWYSIRWVPEPHPTGQR